MQYTFTALAAQLFPFKGKLKPTQTTTITKQYLGNLNKTLNMKYTLRTAALGLLFIAFTQDSVGDVVITMYLIAFNDQGCCEGE